MHTIIPRADILTALTRTQGVIDRKPSNPALSQALIETTPTGLRVTATDTLTTLVGDYAASVTTPGRVCVDATNALASVKAMSGDTVTLQIVAGRLAIRCGSSQHNLLIADADDYPPTPVIRDRTALTIRARALSRLITEALFCASPDENRYGLNGIHAETVNADDGTDRLRFITTDGSRLAATEAAYTGRLVIPPKMLLPRKALGEVRKLIDDPDAEWSIAIGERAAIFTTQGLTLYSRLTDGEFPDYRQVLPARHKRRVTVDAAALSTALRAVRVIANDRNHLARFSFEPDRLVVSAASVEAGDARTEAPIELSGSPLLTGFNLTFFQDILANTNAGRLTLELGDALDPCIVRIVDRDDCFFVVMPMRLD